ncbi:MAG TPA: hypothetical protein VLM79_05485 [Kofleriaceae bacterium]|nr:hypothetical protein [Kofleriaceae bacterium]
MESADAHADRAERHRQAARPPDSLGGAERYSCGNDFGLSDQATSGGERLLPTVPCWDFAEENAEHQRFLAAREERIARTERREATAMVETEIAACRGLSAREREHSPLSHKKEIATVIPHRETGTIRGVRIVFKPVPGLTAAWMRQAIACHRARFERLGEPATYLSEDPSLVAKAEVSVETRRGHLEVLIATDDPASAQVALQRAEDLYRPRTAGR